MSKAEKFIEEHTKDSFNYNSYAQVPIPWLTPDQARKAVEIAREEIYEWLQKCLPSYIVYCNNEGVLKGTELYVNDLKQAMRDE